MTSADIHHLQSRLYCETTRRLAQTLAAKVENGEDLGPRRHQMTSVLSSLDLTLEELRLAAATLPDGSDNIEPLMQNLRVELLKYVKYIEQIVVGFSLLSSASQSDN